MKHQDIKENNNHFELLYSICILI